jgi:hypothetical protein
LISHPSTSPSAVERWDVSDIGLVVAQIGDKKVIETEKVADLATGTVGEVTDDDRDEDLDGLDSEVSFSGHLKRPHVRKFDGNKVDLVFNYLIDPLSMKEVL